MSEHLLDNLHNDESSAAGNRISEVKLEDHQLSFTASAFSCSTVYETHIFDSISHVCFVQPAVLFRLPFLAAPVALSCEFHQPGPIFVTIKNSTLVVHAFLMSNVLLNLLTQNQSLYRPNVRSSSPRFTRAIIDGRLSRRIRPSQYTKKLRID